jgi:hypothetical protein
MPGTGGAITASTAAESAALADTAAVSTTPADTSAEDGPLLLPAEARARGEPCGDWFGTPAPSYISAMAFVYVHVQCTVPGYKSHLMYRNKLVLS